MNRSFKLTAGFLLSLLCFASAFGQKSVKVRLEEVEEKCKGLSPANKLRVSVARFNVTTPNRGGEFGENMATMLSNALQQTNCYRMLAQLKNLNDLKGEIEFAKSENSNGENAPQGGQMMAAQLVVTGEITEYSLQKKNMGIGILKTGSNVAKIGFVLQLLNPQTREIINSKSINVEGKTGGGVKVGVRVPLFGDINAGSGSNEDPAVANALEQGIIEAVEYMSAEKDKLATMIPVSASTAGKITVITIKNTDFDFLSSLGDAMKTAAGVTDVQKKLSDGTRTLTLKHAGTTDDLLSVIGKTVGTKVSVTDFSDGKVTLKIK